MSNVVTHRTKEGKTGALIGGIAVIVLGSAAVYGIGYAVSQGSNFAVGTNFSSIIHNHSVRYGLPVLAMLIQLVAYLVMFNVIDARSETEYLTINVKGGDPSKKHIYSGWTAAGIIGACVVYLVAIVIHYFAFQRNTILIAPLMWWVCLLQTLVCVSVFFLPFTKPLKKFGS